MKILLVNKFHYKKGGSETYYFTIAEALNKAGHEVIFFSMHDEKNIPCEQDKYFISNVSKKGGIKSKLKMVFHIVYSKEAYKKITELLKAENPDVVILNLVHKQITCSIIDAIKDYNSNIKIVWTMHDLITICPSYTMLDGNLNICEKCLDGNFKHCLKNKCVHGSKLMSYLSMYEAKQIKKHGWYNKVDVYICPSNFYKNKLEKAKFTTSKIVYIPNPLSADVRYGISNDVKDYILYFGRLSKEKGVLTLISAMQYVNQELIILGTGPIEEDCKRLVKELNIDDKVQLLGFKTGKELEEYVSKAKVVVLPSEWYENGPYSAMEAMAKGRPLIVSNLGGLLELVENGKNGFIFEAKNIDSLVNAINKLYQLNEKEYEIFENNSLLKAQNTFNPEKYVINLLSQIGKEF